jgi:hypothetical protein
MGFIGQSILERRDMLDPSSLHEKLSPHVANLTGDARARTQLLSVRYRTLPTAPTGEFALL